MTSQASEITTFDDGALVLVRAANPGPMTLDGTNSWLLFSADFATAVVIDPGPELQPHIAAILQALDHRGATMTAIVLTHWHADHSESLASASRWAPEVPVYAVSGQFRTGTDQIADGDRLTFGSARGDQLVFLLTPGHTSDSLSVLWGETLLPGDMVLGSGTTVVTYPDGSIAEYLRSIERMQQLAVGSDITRILPGHGPVIDDPQHVLGYYLRHRQERLDQVRAALDAGDSTAEQVVDRVYADVPENVRPAALQSVKAQLVYLDSGATKN
ncbi:MBL fold metallo-hydrolase [Saxibacter everestensis]|uniref:MBL fold metallo-hydrolase n=1 Tax=Saxibacter everestensis TaxID=2909229 RepID=A0ABY8QQ18_9MICO|nr:MBL fold metallo-hydrolase [Brevibacteriaceae bacterium ZFBP1038]